MKTSRFSLLSKILITLFLTISALSLINFILYSVTDKKKSVQAIIEKARAICLMAESTRAEMEEKWQNGILNIEMIKEFSKNNEKDKIVSTVPVVSSWRAAMMKSKEGSYTFRVPKFQPRNPTNEPDYGLNYKIEGPAISKIVSEGLKEYYVIDTHNNSVRYFLPVKLSKTCLLCHGDPSQSKDIWGLSDGLDPTGGKMENWKEGEIHGAFEVIQSLDEADEKLKSNLIKAGLTALLGIIAAGGVFFIVIKKNILGPINMVVDVLDEGVKQFTEASNQISESSNKLADGATSQAASLEETSASIEEMTRQTRKNADHAEKAHSFMEDVGDYMKVSKIRMKELTASMDQVVKASEEISKIIKVIDEIAFQTNILSLNAAVEAARAGSAGAGFAVVAEEVRRLALRVAEAAKDTADLIEDTIKRISRGGEVVIATEKTFADVVKKIEEVSVSISEIATASNEQATGIEQINQAVIHMSGVVQGTAAIAEESASSSTEMSSQASKINEIIDELIHMVYGSDIEERKNIAHSQPTDDNALTLIGN